MGYVGISWNSPMMEYDGWCAISPTIMGILHVIEPPMF
jgi:hypothetical protein